MTIEQIEQLKSLMAQFRTSQGDRKVRAHEQLTAYLAGCLDGEQLTPTE